MNIAACTLTKKQHDLYVERKDNTSKRKSLQNASLQLHEKASHSIRKQQFYEVIALRWDRKIDQNINIQLINIRSTSNQ